MCRARRGHRSLVKLLCFLSGRWSADCTLQSGQSANVNKSAGRTGECQHEKFPALCDWLFSLRVSSCCADTDSAGGPRLHRYMRGLNLYSRLSQDRRQRWNYDWFLERACKLWVPAREVSLCGNVWVCFFFFFRRGFAAFDRANSWPMRRRHLLFIPHVTVEGQRTRIRSPANRCSSGCLQKIVL